MLKKKVIPIAKASIGLKCGDCMHFKMVPKFERVCSHESIGVKHYANAPSCFGPNVFKLKNKDPKVLYQIGVLLNDFDASDFRIFQSILNQGPTLEKRYKLKFGQPVFFCIGSDYLSNYYRGYVVSAAAQGDDQVYVSSSLEQAQRKHPMMATLMRASVFTNSEFKKARVKLLKADRIMDPKPLFSPTPVVIDEPSNYVPRSMETAPPEWFDKVAKKTKKKNRIKVESDGTVTFTVKR